MAVDAPTDVAHPWGVRPSARADAVGGDGGARAGRERAGARATSGCTNANPERLSCPWHEDRRRHRCIARRPRRVGAIADELQSDVARVIALGAARDPCSPTASSPTRRTDEHTSICRRSDRGVSADAAGRGRSPRRSASRPSRRGHARCGG